MKILIYGAGVIGSIFAAKLSLSGQDVTVLARNKRFEEIKNAGIVLRHPQTMRLEKTMVKVIDCLPEDAVFDYILVVMQRNQVDAILPQLAKNPSKNVVFVVNTASGYSAWQKAIGTDRVMIGFPSAGGVRKDGIVDYFIGHGLMRVFQTTTFGECHGEQTPRVKTLIQAFRKAGIPTVFHRDMDVWQKTHVAIVTCIANALYGHQCKHDELARSRRDVLEMIQGIKEGFAVLRALGMRPTPAKLGYMDWPASLLTPIFKIVLNTKLAETTMAQHCRVAQPEMICLQQEFDALIVESNIPTPHITALKEKLLNNGTVGEKTIQG